MILLLASEIFKATASNLFAIPFTIVSWSNKLYSAFSTVLTFFNNSDWIVNNSEIELT